MARVGPLHERHLRARKQKLLTNIGGTVVELGPGTGVNFAYLARDIRWIGIEPNRHLHPKLREAGRDHSIEILELGGERLPMEDASADAVLATLVLCSVRDPAVVLAEIRRILKPGGRFFFVEHVAGTCGSRIRGRQNFIQPVWRFLADGCCPNRETLRVIREAGFTQVHADEFTPPLGPFSPHIAGYAVR